MVSATRMATFLFWDGVMATYQTRKGKNKTTITATVRIKGHKPITNTFPTKKAARAWAGEIEAAIYARKYNDPRLADSVSLGAALDKYQAKVSVKKAATTHDREKRTIKVLRRSLGEETPMSQITPRIVAQYRDERMDDDKASAYSVRQELSLLSDLYNIARKEWELPVKNPVDDVKRPSPPKGRERFLSIEEGYRLIAECAKSRNKKLHPFILTLLQTGMRTDEAAKLTWEQVDLEHRSLYLPDTKNDDDRTVPLTQAVCQLLKNLKSDEATGKDLIFLTKEQYANPRYKLRPGQAFRTAYELARKRAGLTDVRMHDFRHTAGSWMLARKVPLRVIAAILGHRTMQMVMRYTHVPDESALEAIDTIGDLGLDDHV
jgi:integrase